METEASHSLITRPTLLFRLRDWDDSESWTEFYRLYRKLVFGLARRSGLTHEESEEVAQDVFKRVAETVHEFECNPTRGSFRGWIMNLTRWRITDKFRERRKTRQSLLGQVQEDGDFNLTIEDIPTDCDDEKEEREWQQHVLKAALARIARKVPAKHFQAFELYTQQHWPVLKISAELGVNPASLYLISHRLTKELRREVDRLKAILL